MISPRNVSQTATKQGIVIAQSAVELFGEYLTIHDVRPAITAALGRGDYPLCSFLAKAFWLSSWELDHRDLAHSTTATWPTRLRPGRRRGPLLSPRGA